MTAEERMAYFRGEMKRTNSVQEKKEGSREMMLFKLKFFICMILFVLFLSLDYTGYQIQTVGGEKAGSTEIMNAVRKNTAVPQKIETYLNKLQNEIPGL